MALKLTKQLQAFSKSPDIAKVRSTALGGTSAITVLKPGCPELHGSIISDAQVLAVFPFFQVDFSSTQQKMMYRLTRVPRLMGVLGAAMGFLPVAIQRWLVNWWGGALHSC